MVDVFSDFINILKRARLTKDAEIMTIRIFMIPQELADDKSLLSDYARNGEFTYESDD